MKPQDSKRPACIKKTLARNRAPAKKAPLNQPWLLIDAQVLRNRRKQESNCAYD
jgi:hypothetical protein